MRMRRVVTLGVGVLLLGPLWSSTIHGPVASPLATARRAPVTAEAAATRAGDPSTEAHPPAVSQEPAPGSLASLDGQNGFRDLHFGDPPTSGMVLTSEAGDKTYYTRPDDDLSIDGAHVDRLIYGFSHRRLSIILLQTKGLAESRALLEMLRHAYGPGAQPDSSQPRYSWRGSRVSVSYHEDAKTHDAETWFRQVPMPAGANQEAKPAKPIGRPRPPGSAWQWTPFGVPDPGR